ncbi:MAG TPA: hypothetical protein PLF66_14940, partial [Leptospiraceae bacterium]|nr:hypothetical protein [Leptospiraceae bacterium]
LFQFNQWNDPVVVTHNLLPIFILFFLFILLFFFNSLFRFYGRNFFILTLNFLSFLFIGIDIEPHYFEFWILPASLFTIYFSLFWNYIYEKSRDYFLLTPIASILGIFFFVSASIVSIHNYRYELIFHSRNFKTEGVYEKIGETPIEYFKSSANYKYPNNPYQEVDSFNLK